jgi:predicted GH43/DUF377 family glycosyl hydrolase
MAIPVKRTNIVIRPNPARVLFRPFAPSSEARFSRILGRAMALSEGEVEGLVQQIMGEFHGRHQRLTAFFLHRFEQVKRHMLTDTPVSETRKLLIGAYFTQEYSLESAALFNPSLVWHPSQDELPDGSRRFIVSLRATGEGHISSLTFRSGVIDKNCNITLAPSSRFVTAPHVAADPHYEKPLFLRKLFELGAEDRFAESVLGRLGDTFTLGELRRAVVASERQWRSDFRSAPVSARVITALAESNYEISHEPDIDISERVIFPHSPTEQNGIEDARFVRFVEDDGRVRYLAPYTAYDGRVMLPQLLETTDFLTFKIGTLNGREVQNKGMALFPRKVNGHYAMVSRQDNENLFLMYSEALHFWHEKHILIKPTFPWEFVQIGNCGSPIETREGWLVLSHGVGPMRKYSIGAYLLDLDDPSKVIGRSREPLLTPDANEREGYVPNVVYSCGAVIHGENLLLPYAMSDYASTFCTIPLKELLADLKGSKV